MTDIAFPGHATRCLRSVRERGEVAHDDCIAFPGHATRCLRSVRERGEVAHDD